MRSRAVIVFAALGAALVTGGWFLQRGLSQGADTAVRAKLFDEVLDHVQRDYVDSIPLSALYAKATTGMVDGLHDPYSAYLTPDRERTLTESTTGNYAGLGVHIDVRDGWIVIIAPLPGSPAATAGVQSGDRIISVNGRSTEGWTLDDARGALRGKPGTLVELRVERPGVPTPLSFDVRRSDIHVRSVSHALMLADGVGYVNLSIFSDSSADELRDAIGALRRRGATTLLLDLRSNPGGLLEQGVNVAGLFLDPGQRIVSMRGRAFGTTHDFTDETRELWPELSLIALVDGHTASAAEIVAGALQDHDRAMIIGSTTYGKGVAQSVYPLASGSGALKLTTARWLTPSGRSIQKPRADTADDDDADAPDSTGELPLSSRRAYHTDDGRTVYGGGGITPDLIVASGDSASGLLAFWRLLGPDIPRFRDALTEEALALKAAHQPASPEFVVTPAMREALWHRMRTKGVSLDRARFDASRVQVDRLLGDETTRFGFGSDAAFRRRAAQDRVIQEALALARGAHGERDLLMRAAARRAAKREDVPPTPATP